MHSHDLDPCIICKEENAKTKNNIVRDGLQQECPRCGAFFVTGSALALLNQHREYRHKISSWIRTQNMSGERIVEINVQALEQIKNSKQPPLVERAEYVLKYLISKNPGLGEKVNLLDSAIRAIGYCKNIAEIEFLTNYLIDQKWVAESPYERSYLVTAAGHVRYDEISRQRTESTQGFVAMWFDPQMQDTYRTGIKTGIEKAGFSSFRVDTHEHTNKIDDEIIRQIRRSRFLVADFTGHRGGVYFEAGFALGLNLPIIWTCRSDEIKNLHFDIRQYNCINWTNPKQLSEALHKRIEALIGIGPLDQRQ